MMDRWVVIDRYDDMREVATSVHMTPKGAYVKAYQILHEIFDNLCEQSAGWDEGDVAEVEQELMKSSKTLYDMVMNNTRGYDEEKLEVLQQHLYTFSSLIHENSDYSCDVSVERGRLRT